MQERPLHRAAVFFLRRRQSRKIAVVAAAAEIVGLDIHIVVVGVTLVRRLVEEARARVVAGVMTGGADVVDAGIARQIAAGLVRTPWRPAAAAERRGIAEAGLMTAAHHPADAVH